MFMRSFTLRSFLFLLTWRKSLKQTSNLLLVTGEPGSAYDGESGSGYDVESGSGYEGESGSGYERESGSSFPLNVYENEGLLFYKNASYVGGLFKQFHAVMIIIVYRYSILQICMWFSSGTIYPNDVLIA